MILPSLAGQIEITLNDKELIPSLAGSWGKFTLRGQFYQTDPSKICLQLFCRLIWTITYHSAQHVTCDGDQSLR